MQVQEQNPNHGIRYTAAGLTMLSLSLAFYLFYDIITTNNIQILYGNAAQYNKFITLGALLTLGLIAFIQYRKYNEHYHLNFQNHNATWAIIYLTAAIFTTTLGIFLSEPLISNHHLDYLLATGLTVTGVALFKPTIYFARQPNNDNGSGGHTKRNKNKQPSKKPETQPTKAFPKTQPKNTPKPKQPKNNQPTYTEPLPETNPQTNNKQTINTPTTPSIEQPQALEVVNNNTITFDQVIGMHDAKTDLKESIYLIEHPELQEKYGLTPIQGILLYGPPGTGKCLAKGTPVLMYDGQIKEVQDVKPGELVMGPDSKPRLVENIARGREKMYEIVPNKGESFTVNESHIISLKMSGPAAGYKKGDIVNMTISEYLETTSTFKHYAKTWRTGVEFSEKPVPVDPYFLGLWLGDGCNYHTSITTIDKPIKQAIEHNATKLGLNVHNIETRQDKTPVYRTVHTVGKRGGQYSNNKLWTELKELNLPHNKHIPLLYKANSREIRLQLLAGILDTDGSLTNGGFDFISKDKKLADDVAYLARSLGLASYVKPSQKEAKNSNAGPQDYYRVSISGDCSVIPTRLKRKQAKLRKQKKDVLVTGFKVIEKNIDNYYGFSLLGTDRLFLLGDFTVTHNTYFAKAAAGTLKKKFLKVNTAELVNKYVGETEKNIQAVFEYARAHAPCILFFDEFDALARDRSKNQYGWENAAINQLLTELDGISTNTGQEPIVIAATNYPEVLDKAVLRPGRFDKKIKVGLPDTEMRFKLLQMYLKKRVTAPNLKLRSIAEQTDGWSAAEIKQLIDELARKLFREQQREGTLGGPARPITNEDFQEVIKQLLATKNDDAFNDGLGF